MKPLTLLYRTRYSNDTIVQVEAAFVEKNWVTLSTGERVKRSSIIRRYHDTFEGAKHHVRRLQEIRLKHLLQRVEATRLALRRIESKTKPDNAHDCTRQHPETLLPGE